MEITPLSGQSSNYLNSLQTIGQLHQEKIALYERMQREKEALMLRLKKGRIAARANRQKVSLTPD